MSRTHEKQFYLARIAKKGMKRGLKVAKNGLTESTWGDKVVEKVLKVSK